MIFLDASAWIGYLAKRDQWHKEAVSAWHLLERHAPVVTSNLIVTETLDYLSRRADAWYAYECARRIMNDGLVSIVYVDRHVDEMALDLFRHYAAKGVGFTCCTSFAVMQLSGIERVLTFDSDFRKAGFMALPIEA